MTQPLTFCAGGGEAIGFRVDQAKRTISGLAVPWGAVAYSKGHKWRFQRGSLRWEDTSRVKMNRAHDPDQSFGVAVELVDTERGLESAFRIARTEEGDAALMSAADGVEDGLSIFVLFEDGDGWTEAEDGVRDVYSALLHHVTLTADPAFVDARVASVAATRSQEGTAMTATATEPTTAPSAAQAVEAPDLATFTAGLTDAVRTAVTAAFEAMQDVTPRATIPAGTGLQVTYEPPVYTLTQGLGAASFVRDAWKAQKDHDRDAIDRLQKFQRQQADISGKVNAAGLQFSAYAAQAGYGFATGTTANLAQVIPPGYRPELYVPQLFQGRPLTDSLSRGAISDATPFTVPKFVSATGMAQNHVEGSNATDGTLTMTTVTVTPSVVDGLFKVTREIVDSSNPAVDAIALQAMREAYSQNTEAKVYAELNGANGVGGTITTGFVPSGAAVRTSTGTAAATSGRELLRTLRTEMAAYPFRRFGPMDRIVLSQEGTTAFATATDTTERPLLPPLAPQNAAGTTDGLGTPVQGFNVDGLAARPAWSMTGNAAGDADLIGFNHNDAWAWESPTMAFRYEERSGPAVIELALWGYFATRILRASGFSGIRHTVT